jgi:hypothetical protein
MILWLSSGRARMRWRPAAAGLWVRRFGLWDSSAVRPAAQRLVVACLPFCDNVHGNCAAMIDMMTRERASRLCGG